MSAKKRRHLEDKKNNGKYATNANSFIHEQTILMNDISPLKTNSLKLVERQYLLPFILITSLFALWGFANDITNPMVAAFLVMAIVGGALMPPMQGRIIDMGTLWGMPAVNMSFLLPLVCFLVIIVYGYRSYVQIKK